MRMPSKLVRTTPFIMASLSRISAPWRRMRSVIQLDWLMIPETKQSVVARRMAEVSRMSFS